MRIYIIAGEKSGDQHAAALLAELKKHLPGLTVRAVGGPALQATGAEIGISYEEINFMGVYEVIKNISTIRRKIKEIKQDIAAFKPDATIHVDASSLNLRLAAFVKTKQIPTLYYIAPKVWAWNTDRVYKIKPLFDKLFVILPFEKTFYERYGLKVTYAGNPTYEAVSRYKQENKPSAQPPYVALLAGSRKQEVSGILPTLVNLAQSLPETNFKLAAVSNLAPEVYAQAAKAPNITVVFDQAYNILANAEAAVVVSGTATLETALFKVPQVVIYKTSAFTAFVVGQVIKVPYISLVNLIANRAVVPELIQDDCTPDRIRQELVRIMHGGTGRAEMLSAYNEIAASMGNPHASQTAAQEIATFLLQRCSAANSSSK